MKRYVADTQVVLWHLGGDKRLSRRARTIFHDAQEGQVQILVPSIVLVESVYVLQRKRLPANVVARVLALPDSEDAAITVYPLTAGIARECNAFGPASIPEMPDRVIAATARHLGLPLLSADPIIAESGMVAIVW